MTSLAVSRTDLLAVLAGTGAVAAVLASPEGDAATFVMATVTLSAMIAWIAWQDLRSFTIPDGPLAAVALIGAATRIGIASYSGDVSTTLFVIALDAAICGGALWALREAYFRLHGFDGLGFGDVKLASVGGILVGIEAFAWALLAASLAALAAVALAKFVQPTRKIQRLPFGAFLAPACWTIWAFQAAGTW